VDKKEHPDLALSPVQWQEKDYHFDGQISPGAFVYGDLTFNATPDLIKQINAGTQRIYVYGRIEYDDVFGIHHWATFCQFYLASGAYTFCPNYNETDRNEKPAPSVKAN